MSGFLGEIPRPASRVGVSACALRSIAFVTAIDASLTARNGMPPGDRVMRTTFTIRGIDPGARSRLKREAHRTGVSMGEWVHRMIGAERARRLPGGAFPAVPAGLRTAPWGGAAATRAPWLTASPSLGRGLTAPARHPLRFAALASADAEHPACHGDPGATTTDKPAPFCGAVPIRRMTDSITPRHVPEVPETDSP